MYKFLAKRGSTIALVASLVIVVIFYAIIGTKGGSTEGIPKEEFKNITTFDFGLYAAIAMVFIGLAIVVLFSISNLFTNFKNSLGTLLGLGAILILFFVIYSMAEPAGSERISFLMQKFDVSEGLGKAISGGIWTTIIMAVLALVSIVAAEVWNAFK